MTDQTRRVSPFRRRVALPLAAVLAISVIQGLQSSFYVPTSGRLRVPAFGWWLPILWQIPLWLTWWVIAIGIFALCRKYPLDTTPRRRSLAVHAVAAVVIAPTVFLMVSSVLRAGLSSALLTIGIGWSGEEELLLQAGMNPFYDIPYAVTHYFAFPVLLYAATVALYYALTFRSTISRHEVERAHLETSLARSQLHELKLQLQPHFLFNTLNTIGSLMGRDVPAARQVLNSLADLLRETLRDADSHEWTLEEELEFLRGYVGIQQARFREKLSVIIDADSEARRKLVPRLLLQPLVENAVQHGVPDDGIARVHVAALLERNELHLTVRDNGPGFPRTAGRDGGIGLRNSRDRLARLYGPAATLDTANNDGVGAAVDIRLPAREAVTSDHEPKVEGSNARDHR